MASSGSFSGSIRDGHYKLRVDWSQTKNVSANTSTITAKMYLVNDWSLSINSRSSNYTTIAGTKKTYTSPAISSTGTHLLGTVSQTVTHDSDGSKSISISSVFYIQATLSGTYYDSISASATITLDSIPRASSISMSAGTMGSASTITISRASSSFTHTLTYTFGEATGTIATKTTATSVSWTPALTLANQVPDATSGTATIKCTTYNGTTTIGSKSITVKLSVPTSVVPTITSLTATRVNGDVPSAWGIYVKTKSKATLTINGAAGAYGSTIKSYSISGGSFSGTASTLTTGFLNTSGSITFTAKVTDSRGRTSAAKTVTITVVDYAPPVINSVSTIRCTSGGVANDEGTYASGTVSFSYASCSSKNTITTKVEYKVSGASSYTNANKTFSNGTAVVFGGSLSTETSYQIRYSITDQFSTVSVEDVISTAAVVMDFKAGGKGVAVGKVAETDNMFEVSEDWDVKVYGKLLKDYIQSLTSAIYPVGSIYMSVKSTNPSTYFGGTWVAWGTGRVPVGVNSSDTNFSTVEKTGGASTVTLTTSQMPSHTHTFTGSSATTGSNGAHTHTINFTKTEWSGSSSSRVVVDSKDYTALSNSKTASAGAHTHTVTAKGTNASTGGGGSHTNLQPYITCYMWKRTA